MNTKSHTQKAPKAFRTISEVAIHLDLQPYVIRFWESQFKQIKPMRKKGGRRYYRPGDIEFLKGIKDLLHEKNFTIKRVKEEIIKKGKSFIISSGIETKIMPPKTDKQKIVIKFSHEKSRSLYFKTVISEEDRLQVKSIVETLNQLRKNMLIRKNI